ncbi:hypothetical protein KUCAC02_019901 [Chaenocephalus aceratus]|uniref:Uncharacterized protein n=1 Tax=Chaenocephalus aceratus TaxID=36190 RepID=A0ACB9VR83_CHAAC|nr:hypothetical protein KUCAC02_019901 [Chaenocephalus aceratus]
MKGKDNKRVPLHATQKKTPICGFIACGRSVIGIYENLVEQPAAPCRYLLTYKLSEDHLELFFSAIRARGGYNNNPNVRQFRGAYTRLLVRHQVKKGTGNCLLSDNTIILDSTPANINMARRLGIEPVEEIVTEDDTLANLPDVKYLSEYKEAAISYIAGFIVKQIEQKVTCMPCSHALTSADSVHPFVTLKNRGGLQKTITRHHFIVVVPLEADVDAPLEADVDTPLEADVDAPLKVDIDIPLEADVDAPLEADVDASLEADVDTPLEADVDAPPTQGDIDASLEADVDASLEADVDTPLEADVDAPLKVDIDTH